MDDGCIQCEGRDKMEELLDAHLLELDRNHKKYLNDLLKTNLEDLQEKRSD